MTEEPAPASTTQRKGSNLATILLGLLCAAMFAFILLLAWNTYSDSSFRLDPVVIESLERSGYTEVEILSRDSLTNPSSKGCPLGTEKFYTAKATVEDDPSNPDRVTYVCLGDGKVIAIKDAAGAKG